MIPLEDEAEAEDGTDKSLSMVDEALVAGTIANTNGLLVILAKMVAKGVFDREDLQAFSDSYSKPLDHVGMRENELVGQMQDQMELTLAELMRFLSDREREELMRALAKLLVLIAVLLLPFSMAPAAATATHHQMASMPMQHCPEQDSNHHSKLAFAVCTMACSAALPALDRCEAQPVPTTPEQVRPPLAQHLSDLHPDIATPPPRLS